MTKSGRKLQLRSETIRALRVLDNLELQRAVGGDGAAVLIESGRNCPLQALPVVATTPCG
jgi:hypothetical protein